MLPSSCKKRSNQLGVMRMQKLLLSVKRKAMVITRRMAYEDNRQYALVAGPPLM